MKASYFDMSGKSIGEKDLADSVFGAEVKEGAIHEAIKNENANKRSGNHKAKNRIDVRGGGAKPWRQKGTGRARHGSSRSPIWVGGGVAHGPLVRDYSYNIPRKMKQAALRSILSKKAASGDIAVIKDFKMESFSTKTIAQMIKGMKWDDRKNLTIVLGDDSPELKRSVRNIGNVDYLVADRLSARGLLYNAGIIIGEDAAEKISTMFGAKK